MAMYTLRMAKRMLFETNKRLLWKLFWRMGIKGTRSVLAHKRAFIQGGVRWDGWKAKWR